MENVHSQDFDTAIWYKLEKDRITHLIPVFTDYGMSTQMGGMLYDKDIVSRKVCSELPTQSAEDTRVWFLDIDPENAASVAAAGITIPAEIETVESLSQLRAVFNKRQPH